MSESQEQTPASFFVVGLDLGQAADYSAAVVLQRFAGDGKAQYACPAIKRWPLGTSYTGIVADLVKMFAGPLAGALLIADITGCGKPVFDMVRDTQVQANLRGVLITGGAVETLHAEGIHHVAKTILISTTQVVLQQRRIRFAEKMPETSLIIKEMQGYRMRLTLQANEVYAARDSEHDDLIMALALALWAGERHDRFKPQMHVFDLKGMEPVEVEEDDIGPDGLTQYQRERLPGYRPPEQIAEAKEFDRLIRMSEAERKAEEDKRLWEYLTGPAAFVGGEEVEDGWQDWR